VADFYTVTGAVQGVRVVSQTQVIDVEEVSIATKPSGVALTVAVPLTAWQSGGEATYLEPPAELVEELMQQGSSGAPLVSAVAQVQDTDGSGLLASYLELTVSYTPPSPSGLPFTARVRIPFASFASLDAFAAKLPSGQTPSELIEAAYNRLRSTASG
jgi:hypothetical protein